VSCVGGDASYTLATDSCSVALGTELFSSFVGLSNQAVVCFIVCEWVILCHSLSWASGRKLTACGKLRNVEGCHACHTAVQLMLTMLYLLTAYDCIILAVSIQSLLSRRFVVYSHSVVWFVCGIFNTGRRPVPGLSAWPAAAIVRSRVCAHTICIVCAWPPLTSV